MKKVEKGTVMVSPGSGRKDAIARNTIGDRTSMKSKTESKAPNAAGTLGGTYSEAQNEEERPEGTAPLSRCHCYLVP